MSYRFTPPEGRHSQTLHQVLVRRAASRGEAPWIVGETRSWTYRDIDSMSHRIANGLAARGIAKGDTVPVMLPDRVQFIAAWCGLARFGAAAGAGQHPFARQRARAASAGACRGGRNPR